MRPMGTALAIAALNWAVSSAFLPKPFEARSVDGAGADRVDANLAVFEILDPGAGEGADSGFCGAVNAESRSTFYGDDGGIENDRAAVGEERKRFLDGKEEAFDVGVECLVVMGFRDGTKWSEFAATGVGEENVDAALLLLDGGVETIEVGEIGNVALDGGDVFADEFDGGIELGLAAAGDEDVGAFVG